MSNLERRLRAGWLALAALLAGSIGCEDSAPAPTGAPVRSVTQGGAQDIGRFRQLVQQRVVPDRGMLDEVGFFNEHALDLAPPTCGQPLCVHPLLAVAPRSDGGNWTMGFVALNTTVDPSSLVANRPRHFLIVIEKSREVQLNLILSAFADKLRASLTDQDVFSLVLADRSPRVTALTRPRQELDRQDFYAFTLAEGEADLFGALTLAYQVASAPPVAAYQQQVLLLTSGSPGVGIRAVSAFEALGRRFAERDVVISTFGMGNAFNRAIPQALSETTSGNQYFVTSKLDLEQAVTAAGQTGFVPLARNLRLLITAAPGFKIGEVHGGKRIIRSDRDALLEVPTTFLGARVGASDVTSGRRGGGGGFFIELLAQSAPGATAVAAAPAFTLEASYLDAANGAPHASSFTVETPLGAGNNPEPSMPIFSDPLRVKPYMMVNLYLGLRAMLDLYEAGDCGAALGVTELVQPSYEAWRARFTDADIDADFNLLLALRLAIQRACTAPPTRPVLIPIWNLLRFLPGP